MNKLLNYSTTANPIFNPYEPLNLHDIRLLSARSAYAQQRANDADIKGDEVNERSIT